MKFSIRWIAVVFFALGPVSLLAQVQVQTGTPPFGTFTGGPIDTVNEQNLNVHLAIPILHKAGRGLPLDIDLTYDNTVWQASPATWTPALNYCVGADMPSALMNWGWYFHPLGCVYTAPQVMGYCYTGSYITGSEILYPFYYYDGSGTFHSFPGGVIRATGTCGSGYLNNPWTALANDGSGLTITVNMNVSATITDAHGRKTYFSDDSNSPYFYISPVQTDTNGNQISDAMTAGTSYNETITDTIGQTLTITGSGTTTSPVTLTYTDPSGHPATYTIRFTAQTVKANFGCSVTASVTFPENLVSEIDLPDSTKYTFTYESTTGYPGDVTGRVASVTVPTGGTVSYAYSGCPGVGFASTLQRVTPDSGSNYWTYSLSAPSNFHTTTTVTDPQGNQTVTTFLGLETERQVYQGLTTLLETTYTCYNGMPYPCNATSLPNAQYGILQKTEYLTWPNGKESETNATYATAASYSLGLVAEEDDYDYGSGAPGSLLRKTTTGYASLSNGILDRPSQVSVYDGSSNLKAQTNYTYDGSSLVASGITTQHISVSGSRGNATTISRLVGGSTYVNETYTYFDTGTVDVAYDGNNNPTTYTYSSTYAGAYPTTVKNALNQTTTNTYDIHTGLITSTEDPNLLTTSYSYDNMLRTTQISHPDGGQSTICYTDEGGSTCSQSSSPYSIITTDRISSSINRVTQVQVDGFGRQSRSAVTNGEFVPYDETDTCYDSLGNLDFNSYPYESNPTNWSGSVCPSSEPGDLMALDPLGRAKTVTHSDGSYISVSYSGNCATTTDEAGKTRESCDDGAGRLEQVIEDPGGLAYSTNYTYDVLDNLTGVTQAGSRQRTFVYDSLSRLTSSVNPEANWSPANMSYVATTYAYDADGNLTSKTEPAPNQNGASTVTLSYCYDALNRMTSKAYTLQSCPMVSPVATYSYDQLNCLGQSTCYNIGHRTSMTDQAGSEAWSYNIVSGSGWQTKDQRTTNSLTKSSVYQYSFLGSPTSITYPSGRVVNYAYNLGDRPISATDATTLVNYANTVHYWAGGAPCWIAYGGAITRAETYNARLQPVLVQATGSVINYTGSCPGLGRTGTLLDLSYNFNYGSGDNGNVAGITNNIDGTRSENFGYDALNRIISAQTTSTYATSPTHCWGETYQFDNLLTGGAWGNLSAITQMTGSYTGCTGEVLAGITVTAQNRISNGSAYYYDTAGNMTTNSGATNTFDAENHLISTAGVTYTYNGDGTRVEKSNGTIDWLGMDGSVLDRTDLTGSVTNGNFHEFFFLNGSRIARRDSSNNIIYYATDHLGTSRVIASVPSGSNTAALCYDADFYPFGGERPYINTCSQAYKFSGKERDTESGLDNFAARFDSSTVGRFMSPDPDNAGAQSANPQSWNMYSYVINKALSLTDPSGRQPDCIDDGDLDFAGDWTGPQGFNVVAVNAVLDMGCLDASPLPLPLPSVQLVQIPAPSDQSGGLCIADASQESCSSSLPGMPTYGGINLKAMPSLTESFGGDAFEKNVVDPNSPDKVYTQDTDPWTVSNPNGGSPPPGFGNNNFGLKDDEPLKIVSPAIGVTSTFKTCIKLAEADMKNPALRTLGESALEKCMQGSVFGP